MKKKILVVAIVLTLIPIGVVFAEMQPSVTPSTDPPEPEPEEPRDREVPTAVLPEPTIEDRPDKEIPPDDTPLPPTPTPTIENHPHLDTCAIDLVKNKHDCKYVKAVTLVVPPRNGQAVVKVRLDPKFGYSRAAFELWYEGQPWGITLNIGDSRTNNGFGGDYWTQSNDAEMQINGDELSVYGNDSTPLSIRNMMNLYHFVKPGRLHRIEVENQSLDWGQGELQSEHLFALAGQPDSEGRVNYAIFAGLNRTIYNASRSGYGLVYVRIILE